MSEDSKEAAASPGYAQARQAKRSELVEDYVELIAELVAETGEARQVDIAARLGVAQPTVAKMLKRLEGERLVARRPYRGTFLTEAGQDLAARSRRRHEVVERFLVCLGLDPATAKRDAEGMEHHVSARTLDVFRAFIEAHPRGTADTSEQQAGPDAEKA